MNLGIVTSYIIAGMLLLGIAMMNIRVQNSSAELTISQMVREYVVNITDMLNDDIPNMGYHVNRTTKDDDTIGNKILAIADSSRIGFYRNLTQDPDRTPDYIYWELKTDTISTSNPAFRTLTRSVLYESTGTPDETDINVGVTDFEIRYYNTVGAPVNSHMATPLSAAQMESVKQIFIRLEVQSREPAYERATGNGRFVTTVWEKRFTPSNININ